MVKSGLYRPFTIRYLLKLGRGDLLDDVALDLVAVLDVVEVFEPDGALPRDDAVADEARARVAPDDAIDDAAARDDARLRHAEGREHERLAQNLLGLDLVEHADHRGAYLLLDLVDDRVEAYVNVLLPREFRRAHLGAHVEADDDDRTSRRLG